MAKSETWVYAEGYEGYYMVSNLGNVKSLDRVSTFTTRKGNVVSRNLKGKMLKPVLQANGYLHINLLGDQWTLHRLVAVNFLPNPSGLPVVLHLDNDKTNCKADNLKWGTVQDNTKQAFTDGLIVNMVDGELHPAAKYSDDFVSSVKLRLATECVKDLSLELSVPVSTLKDWKFNRKRKNQ